MAFETLPHHVNSLSPHVGCHQCHRLADELRAVKQERETLRRRLKAMTQYADAARSKYEASDQFGGDYDLEQPLAAAVCDLMQAICLYGEA
jgi:hypothetical protein